MSSGGERAAAQVRGVSAQADAIVTLLDSWENALGVEILHGSFVSKAAVKQEIERAEPVLAPVYLGSSIGDVRVAGHVYVLRADTSGNLQLAFRYHDKAGKWIEVLNVHHTGAPAYFRVHG